MAGRSSRGWWVVGVGGLVAFAAVVLAVPRDPVLPPAPPAAGELPPVRRETPGLGQPIDAVVRERAEVAAEPARLPIDADARWCEVQVVDAVTGGAVAGAEVVWLYAADSLIPMDLLDGLPPDEREHLASDRELFARRFGSAATTDPQGFARVAVGPGGTSVHCTHTGRYGYLVIDADALPPPSGFRLRLARDRELRVKVVDAEGRPAIGVPVQSVRDGEPESMTTALFAEPVARTQAPDGVARFVHLQERWADPAAEPPGTWRIRVKLPLLTDVAAPFDPWAPPAAPLVLQLRPTGQVMVRTAFAGRQPGHQDTVSLLRDEPPDDADAADAAAACCVPQRCSEPDGWVRFRHVPLGVRFVARTSLAGWVDHVFDGPVAAGEVVRVEVPEPPDVVAFAGRLVDAAGAPLRAVEGHTIEDYQHAGGGGGRYSQPLRTDEHGRFRHLATQATNGQVRFFRLDLVLARAGAPPWRAKLGPRTCAAGTTDLGDVVMAPSALLVAGWLQCPPGVLPTQVGVTVYSETPLEGDPDRSVRNGVEPVDLQRGAAGRFTLFGQAPPGRCLLQVVVRGAAMGPPVPFTPGQRDLLVAVPACHSLWATVRLPEGATEGLTAHLAPAPPAEGGGHATRRSRDGSAVALVWRDVPAGRYSLELGLDTTGTLLRLRDIEIPGPAGGDPRLRGIDLRPLVQVVTVRVTTAPEFAPRLAAAEVFAGASPPDPSWPRPGVRVVDGVARLLLPAGPQALVVVCPGMFSVERTGVQGEVAVELQPLPAGR